MQQLGVILSQYADEEVSTICKQIQARLERKINEEEWECFLKMIKADRKYACDRCMDTRAYNDEKGGVTLCTHRKK